MKKDLAIIFGLFLLIVALLVFGQGYTSLSFGSPTRNAPTSAVVKKMKVTINTLSVEADVAASTSQRRKGLSKKDSLPFGEGMIFVFENPGKFGIWMKDMRFAIDIIWLDQDKKIVDIVTNVAPESGKKDAELTVYKPRADAKYVLEVNAGLVDLNHIQIGDQASF